MQDFPTVSVMVITYNHDAYIRQALESIVCQTGDFGIELVIANDCSTDHTDEVIRRFIKDYTGAVVIKYFEHSRNLGILPNLIFALSQCTGDYLSFCEGDDFWISKDKLQKQFAFYQLFDDCSMVITNRNVIREDRSTYDELYDHFYEKQTFSVSDFIEGFIPGLQTMFARNDRRLVQYLTENKDLGHADRYIAYFFALHGKIYLLPEITAAYRMTGDGAWSAYNGLRRLQVKAEMLEDFHRRIGLPINNVVLARTHFTCAFATLKYCLKRPREFNSSLNRGWITAPWKKFRHMNRIRILWFAVFRF